jgi:hypothetical protein
VDWPIPSRMTPDEATEKILTATRPMTRDEIFMIMAQVYSDGYHDGDNCHCNCNCEEE